jgi:hypothetical protein
MQPEQLCRNYTHFAQDCGRIRSVLSLPRSAQLWSRLPAFRFNASDSDMRVGISNIRYI